MLTLKRLLVYLKRAFNWAPCVFICSAGQPSLRGLSSPCSFKQLNTLFHFCGKQDVTDFPSAESRAVGSWSISRIKRNHRLSLFTLNFLGLRIAAIPSLALAWL